MARNVFYSFHFQADHWRASQVRNMGVIDGNKPTSDNDWEAVKKGGDAAIQNWIDGQLKGRSCAVVLTGNQTANRKWINYEIAKAWNEKMGIVGIFIHGLKDSNEKQSVKGNNPFDFITLGTAKLSGIVKAYDPPFYTSTEIYNHIKNNLSTWVEEAITIRNAH